MIENLTCTQCQQPFTRELARGRKPTKCPGCRGIGSLSGADKVAAIHRQQVLPPREQLPITFGGGLPKVPHTVDLDAILARTLPRVERCFRVRMGANMTLGGVYTQEEANRIANERAALELPPNEGGMSFYVIRETVESVHHG